MWRSSAAAQVPPQQPQHQQGGGGGGGPSSSSNSHHHQFQATSVSGTSFVMPATYSPPRTRGDEISGVGVAPNGADDTQRHVPSSAGMWRQQPEGSLAPPAASQQQQQHQQPAKKPLWKTAPLVGSSGEGGTTEAHTIPSGGGGGTPHNTSTTSQQHQRSLMDSYLSQQAHQLTHPTQLPPPPSGLNGNQHHLQSSVAVHLNDSGLHRQQQQQGGATTPTPSSSGAAPPAPHQQQFLFHQHQAGNASRRPAMTLTPSGGVQAEHSAAAGAANRSTGLPRPNLHNMSTGSAHHHNTSVVGGGSLPEIVASLERALAAEREQRMQALNELHAKERELSAAKLDAERLRGRFESQDVNTQFLRTQLETERRTCEELRKSTATAVGQGEVDQLREQIKSLTTKLEDKERQLTAAQVNVSELRGRLHGFEEVLLKQNANGASIAKFVPPHQHGAADDEKNSTDGGDGRQQQDEENGEEFKIFTRNKKPVADGADNAKRHPAHAKTHKFVGADVEGNVSKEDDTNQEEEEEQTMAKMETNNFHHKSLCQLLSTCCYLRKAFDKFYSVAAYKSNGGTLETSEQPNTSSSSSASPLSALHEVIQGNTEEPALIAARGHQCDAPQLISSALVELGKAELGAVKTASALFTTLVQKKGIHVSPSPRRGGREGAQHPPETPPHLQDGVQQQQYHVKHPAAAARPVVTERDFYQTPQHRYHPQARQHQHHHQHQQLPVVVHPEDEPSLAPTENNMVVDDPWRSSLRHPPQQHNVMRQQQQQPQQQYPPSPVPRKQHHQQSQAHLAYFGRQAQTKQQPDDERDVIVVASTPQDHQKMVAATHRHYHHQAAAEVSEGVHDNHHQQQDFAPSSSYAHTTQTQHHQQQHPMDQSSFVVAADELTGIFDEEEEVGDYDEANEKVIAPEDEEAVPKTTRVDGVKEEATDSNAKSHNTTVNGSFSLYASSLDAQQQKKWPSRSKQQTKRTNHPAVGSSMAPKVVQHKTERANVEDNKHSDAARLVKQEDDPHVGVAGSNSPYRRHLQAALEDDLGPTTTTDTQPMDAVPTSDALARHDEEEVQDENAVAQHPQDSGRKTISSSRSHSRKSANQPEDHEEDEEQPSASSISQPQRSNSHDYFARGGGTGSSANNNTVTASRPNAFHDPSAAQRAGKKKKKPTQQRSLYGGMDGDQQDDCNVQ